ncbi:MAG: hypothetical protein ABSF94_08430 [Steroidobacteraceae bacterium]|jgi:hypothetical protein
MSSTHTAARRWLSFGACLAALGALAGCSGTALVTLTSTAPQTPLTADAPQAPFLSYRVNLLSVTLQNSSGSTTAQALPSSMIVDLARLENVSEVISAAAVNKGNYTAAVVTLDYSDALIIADDGTQTGVTLKPVGPTGSPLGQVTVTLNLDGADPLTVSSKEASRLALNFELTASNVIDFTAGTVTVTPMILASALPIDAKTVRVRGQLSGSSTSSSTTSGSNPVTTTSLVYTTGITPFDTLSAGAGSLQVWPTEVATYEINGKPSTGPIGQTQFAALGSGVWTVAYGTLTSGDSVSTGTSSSSSQNVSFSATEVLAGTSVQGGGSDRLTGVVLARSGDTLTLGPSSLLTSAGQSSFITDTASVLIGSGTAITLPDQSSSSVINTPAQISIGSIINAFGTSSTETSGALSFDASAGRVRLVNTSASGTVTVQGTTGTLTVDLALLAGRSVAPFDFTGTGTSGGATGVDSDPSQYVLTTGDLSLANSIVGAPVQVGGLVVPYGSTPPDFTAATLLDPTTIEAELAVNWGSGTPTPFNSVSTTEIDLLIHNSSIGTEHAIQYGAQSIDFTTLLSDVLIVPSTATTSTVYAIGHASSSTIDCYDTFTAFATALQADLNGTTVATGMSVQGVYTSTSYTLTANSITVYLNI